MSVQTKFQPWRNNHLKARENFPEYFDHYHVSIILLRLLHSHLSTVFRVKRIVIFNFRISKLHRITDYSS
jgi:hypothetical protein